MISLKDYLGSIVLSMEMMVVTDIEGHELDSERGMTRWLDVTREVKHANATMYFVGNGASAMMSSHMAADASKNGGFRSQAFNDTALMTAVSNDIAYEECFASPLRRFADRGDILVTISSSGDSPNIIRSIEAGRELGLYIITLTGMKPGNRSRRMGDLNFYIPAVTYGQVEVSHQAILHFWLDRFIEEDK